jgi:hypothetical protein
LEEEEGKGTPRELSESGAIPDRAQRDVIRNASVRKTVDAGSSPA